MHDSCIDFLTRQREDTVSGDVLAATRTSLLHTYMRSTRFVVPVGVLTLFPRPCGTSSKTRLRFGLGEVNVVLVQRV